MESAVRQRIKYMLEKSNMSENKLAELLGTSQTNVNRWLKNTPIPLSAILKLLSIYPDVSAEWLLRGTKQKENGIIDRLFNGGCGDIGILGDNNTNNTIMLGKENETLKARIELLEKEKQILLDTLHNLSKKA